MEKLNEILNAETANSEFGSKEIVPLFWKYSMFALAGLLFQTSSVVADGIFVGNGIGPIGLATIGIIAPLWVCNVSLFGLFGVGGSTIAAVKLGEGDMEGALRTYGTIITASFLFGVILAIVALLNLENILLALGATPEILPYAKDYAIPYIIGVPLCITGAAAYFFTRVDAQPLPSALAYIVPAILAIILEFILIIKKNWGMAGSSIPWVLCVGLSAFLVPYLQVKGNYFKLTKNNIKIDFKILFAALKVGFATFAIQICTTISIIIINHQIIAYGGGEIQIAAFGVINAYIAYILMIITSAFTTGLQPIASFNMGTGAFKRVAKLIKVGIVQSSLVLVGITILIFIFSDTIVTMFTGQNPELVRTTIAIMQVYLLFYALGNVSQIASGYFQAVEQNGFAFLNGIARIIIFAVPLLFLLPFIFGLKGIWMAQPGADLLSCVLAVILVAREYKKLMRN